MTRTTFARPVDLRLRQVPEAGVRGYLLKDAPSATLAQAIRIVDSGGKSIDPGLAMKAWREDAPLTDREQQVLRPTSKGRTSAEIATQINLSDGTGN